MVCSSQGPYPTSPGVSLGELSPRPVLLKLESVCESSGALFKADSG